MSLRWMTLAIVPLLAAGLVVGAVLAVEARDTEPATVGLAEPARDAPAEPDVEPDGERDVERVDDPDVPATPEPAQEHPEEDAPGQRALRPHLVLGDNGDDVAYLQRNLHAAGYDPGPVNGHFRLATQHAVMAFQKVHGQRPTGEVSLETWRSLGDPRDPEPLVPDGAPTRVEIDLSRQLVVLYEGGEVALVTHASTGSNREFCTEQGGCRRALTPVGDYGFTWRVSGWRESDLGLLYNPVYFHGGIAIHGSYHVPDVPSSYGCVRIPMHIAEYFPERVSRGDPVHVRRPR